MPQIRAGSSTFKFFFHGPRVILSGLFMALVLTGGLPTAQAGPIELHTFKTHSRLTFQVDPQIDAKFEEDGKGFELFFPRTSLADLGAPLGSEEEWGKQWAATLSDRRLKSLALKEAPEGLTVKGQWNFPVGKEALANPVMERFEFRQKSPHRYTLDFWPKEGPTLVEAKKSAEKSRKQEDLQKLEKQAKARRDRRIASEKWVATRENLHRYCEMPLSEDRDVFLPFYPAHEKVDFSRWLKYRAPDDQYAYSDPQGKAKDEEYVRMALDLYRQEKFALVLKTLDFFDKEQPQSPFRMEMRFLRANALLKLNEPQKANDILRSILLQEKSAPFAIQTAGYLTVQALENKKPLDALENLAWLVSNDSESPLMWVYHLALAEAHFQLGQMDRAADEYEKVMAQAKKTEDKAEAAFRKGDTYLQRKDYAQALDAYFSAVQTYPQEASRFPLIHLNRGESLYWLGQGGKSSDIFTAFLSDHSGHPEGWRASYRLGEIVGRRGGQEGLENYRFWMKETTNRFPVSPGATLARLRLLPCGDHGGMSLESARAFFSGEALDFNGSEAVRMEEYSELRAWSRVQALAELKSRDEAIDAAIEELRKNTFGERRGFVVSYLNALFRQSLVEKIQEGKKSEALGFYRQRMGSIPMPALFTHESEFDYLLSLSRAASDLGLGEIAQEIQDRYQGYLKILQEKGPTAVADAQVDPIARDLDLSRKAFTRAKVLWVSQGFPARQKIKDELSEVSQESPYAYGKHILLGLIAQQEKKNAEALEHGLRAQLLVSEGESDSKPEEQARVNYWVARLQIENDRADNALSLLENLEKYRSNSTNGDPSRKVASLARTFNLPAVPSLEDLIQQQTEICHQSGKWSAAIPVYERGIEAGMKSNYFLYQYSTALAKRSLAGDADKSMKVLSQVAESETEDFWKKLAKEALANQQALAKEGN